MGAQSSRGRRNSSARHFPSIRVVRLLVTWHRLHRASAARPAQGPGPVTQRHAPKHQLEFQLQAQTWTLRWRHRGAEEGRWGLKWFPFFSFLFWPATKEPRWDQPSFWPIQWMVDVKPKQSHSMRSAEISPGVFWGWLFGQKSESFVKKWEFLLPD